MRSTVVVLVLAATASPALGQSSQGDLGIDTFVAPTTGVGFSYSLTDALSLRPWLGLGYSDYSGFYASVGAQLSYALARSSRLSPYLFAMAQYSHFGSSGVVQAGTVYEPYPLDGDVGQLGAGAGLRYRLSGSLALFGEGRVMHATSPTGAYGYGWSSIEVNDRTRVDAVLGLTWFLN